MASMTSKRHLLGKVAGKVFKQIPEQYAHLSRFEYVVGGASLSALNWLALRAAARGDLHELAHSALAVERGDSSHCGDDCPWWHRPLTRDELHGRDEFRERVADLLGYLRLHIGRYEWKVLTTEQKDLMADLVDEDARRKDPDEPFLVERWWRE